MKKINGQNNLLLPSLGSSSSGSFAATRDVPRLHESRRGDVGWGQPFPGLHKARLWRDGRVASVAAGLATLDISSVGSEADS